MSQEGQTKQSVGPQGRAFLVPERATWEKSGGLAVVEMINHTQKKTKDDYFKVKVISKL